MGLIASYLSNHLETVVRLMEGLSDTEIREVITLLNKSEPARRQIERVMRVLDEVKQ